MPLLFMLIDILAQYSEIIFKIEIIFDWLKKDK